MDTLIEDLAEKLYQAYEGLGSHSWTELDTWPTTKELWREVARVALGEFVVMASRISQRATDSED